VITQRDCLPILLAEWKKAVWGRYVTGARRPRTPSEHSNTAIAKASLSTLSWELGVNPKPVAEWRK